MSYLFFLFFYTTRIVTGDLVGMLAIVPADNPANSTYLEDQYDDQLRK